MNCECGFVFSGPGELRNCGAFVTINGETGVVCPTCHKEYIVDHVNLIEYRRE